ncbi:putative atp synthase oligomycin sensitivity conferral protein [Lasiodiplodia theobromae]|uniref:ATP synthase subunit 5, mitochondrial n=1 Tax=Lasiodiplodia hormozganensis TaxID=869390 RepID=A0AA39Z087_9PEZI|nr:putative atp synthase oligomycin sensitivity conferral protein [Lasiodiplodia theobromae]KAK0661813.1 ATP synthase subunit 5 [Lasiodiplodia hormozganensis]
MFSARALSRAARTAAPRVARPAVAPRVVATRSYAQAADTKSVKPPVALYGVDGTYASALYTAAAKTSTLEPVSKALENLANVFKKDAKLAEVLSAPTLTESDKKQIVAELTKIVGTADKEGVVKNFLETLAENNRLGVLQPVTEKFAQLMSAYRGEIELNVTSAQPLDNKVLNRLEAAVSKSPYAQGKKLKVVPKVNPDIRGGLIVEIGDRTIDLSVSAKLARMNKLLNDQL